MPDNGGSPVVGFAIGVLLVVLSLCAYLIAATTLTGTGEPIEAGAALTAQVPENSS